MRNQIDFFFVMCVVGCLYGLAFAYFTIPTMRTVVTAWLGFIIGSAVFCGFKAWRAHGKRS